MRIHRAAGGLLAALVLTLPAAPAVAAGGHGTAARSGTRTAGAARTTADPPATRPFIVRDTTWFLRDSLTSGPATTTFGYGDRGDLPMAGDWDGNGTFTPGVVRGNTWFLRNSDT